jgi:hypothetical protein
MHAVVLHPALKRPGARRRTDLLFIASERRSPDSWLDYPAKLCYGQTRGNRLHVAAYDARRQRPRSADAG